MLRSDHYFISQKELYGYFEMINPDVNGAPNTLFESEKKIANWNSTFISLSTVSLVLMTLRLLKALDFSLR